MNLDLDVNFAFKNKIVKYLFWTIILGILISDAYSIAGIIIFNIQLGPLVITSMFIGGVLKLSILACLISRTGPIAQLTFIWSIFFILAGVFGLLELATSEQEEPAISYILKLISVIFGVLLVVLVDQFLVYSKREKQDEEIEPIQSQDM